MKKNKFIINIFVVLILIISSVLLTACVKGGEGSKTPNFPETNIPDTGGDNGNGNNVKIEDLFSKFKVLSKDNDLTVYDVITKQNVEFDYLVDRQISILAEDLIFRLTAVYGAGLEDNYVFSDYAYNNNQAFINKYNIIDRTHSFRDNDLEPIYLYSNGTTTYFTSDYFYEPIITELASYAAAFRSGKWERHYRTDLNAVFRNTHAINGGFAWNNDSFNTTEFKSGKEYWLLKNSNNIGPFSNANSVFEDYLTQHNNTFKLKLANLLAYGENIELYSDNYLEIIKDIDHIGFKQNDRELIINFIKSDVIGLHLIDLDNYRLNNILSKIPNGQITMETLNLLSEDDHYYKAYELLIPAIVERALANSFGGQEPDLYVYNQVTGDILKDDNGKLVKTSVDELKNYTNSRSFVNGQWVESEHYLIYPKMTRSAQTDLEIVSFENNDEEYPDIQMTGLKNIQSIVLQPKNNATVLEIWFAIGTETDVKVEFKVNVKYVANGVTYLNRYIPSFTNNNSDTFVIEGLYDTGESVAGKGVSWMFDLNIYKYIQKNEDGHYISVDGKHTSEKYPVLSAYNGIDIKNSELDIWTNNPFQFNSNNFGDNYVELTFDVVRAWRINGSMQVPMNTSDVKFTIGFSDPISN